MNALQAVVLSMSNHSRENHLFSLICFSDIIIILYVCVFCLHVCLCTVLVSSAQGGPKNVYDSLKLELHVFMNCYEGDMS